MDSRKLSSEACAHAVQTSGYLYVTCCCALLRAGSPTTTTEGECDSVTATEETTTTDKTSSSSEKTNAKGVVMSRIFSKFWTGKDRDGVGDVSNSDTSESPGSATTVDDKSTPSTRRRRSSS